MYIYICTCMLYIYNLDIHMVCVSFINAICIYIYILFFDARYFLKYTCSTFVFRYTH